MSAWACNIDPYHLGGGDDGGFDPADARLHDGGVPDDGGAPDTSSGGPDACVAEPEECDEIDHDCNGDPLNGFNLQEDPANCGECGHACSRVGASGECNEGECSFECLANRWDQNGDLEDPLGDGCEYVCQKSADDDIPCNYRDDDCDCPYEDTNEDGVICGPGDTNVDEGGDFTTIYNCGECFNVCVAANSTPVCDDGDCTFENCTAGYANVDGDDEPTDVIGCEYKCPNAARPDETCNGVDDDCDGDIDELPIEGLGLDCYPPALPGCIVGAGCQGVCSFGTTECALGVEICAGWSGPEGVEQCDALDHDCDGNPYNGFNIQSDPNHCGTSCEVCAYDHGIAACQSGTCAMIGCAAGWSDGNDDDSDGCEYPCTPTGPEVCDGRDNDCDYDIDEELVPPTGLTCPDTGECGIPSAPAPACVACGGVTKWRCLYTENPGVEVDACGERALQESKCDDKDNDCDNQVDETFEPTLGEECDDGEIGICRGVGSWICDPEDDSQLICYIAPGDEGVDPLGYELCNNLDDDCDGLIDSEDTDSDLVDSTIFVAGGTTSDGVTVAPFTMDLFEASRPDADLDSAGSSSLQACSNPDVIPWRNIPRAAAEAACLAAGKRLCTEAEWQWACEGSSHLAYPYASSFDDDACNGWAYDRDCAPPNDHWEILPTGYDYGCPATSDTCLSWAGVYDLSGNAQEWTSTIVDTDPVSYYRVRGGNYQTQKNGLTCQHAFIAFDDTIAFPNLGFRCCQDAL